MAHWRIFVGGLDENIRKEDLSKLFKSHGSATDIEIHCKQDCEGQVVKTFAHVNFTGNLNKCLTAVNGLRWKGQTLCVQKAKESFTDRLKRERAEASRKSHDLSSHGNTKSHDLSSHEDTKSAGLSRKQKSHDMSSHGDVKSAGISGIQKSHDMTGRQKAAMNGLSSDPDKTISSATASVDKRQKSNEGSSNTPKISPRKQRPAKAEHNEASTAHVTFHKPTPAKSERSEVTPLYKSAHQAVNGVGESGVVDFSDDSHTSHHGNTVSCGDRSNHGSDQSSGEETDDLIDRLRTNHVPAKSPEDSKKRKKSIESKKRTFASLGRTNPRSYTSSSSEEEDSVSQGHARSKSGRVTRKTKTSQGDEGRDSDSESDVPDLEAWNLGKNSKPSTHVPGQSTPVPSQSTHAPSQSKPSLSPKVTSPKQRKHVAKLSPSVRNMSEATALANPPTDSPTGPLHPVADPRTDPSSSEEEDLLDAIAAGKLYKLKQIVAQGQSKQGKRHGKHQDPVSANKSPDTQTRDNKDTNNTEASDKHTSGRQMKPSDNHTSGRDVASGDKHTSGRDVASGDKHTSGRQMKPSDKHTSGRDLTSGDKHTESNSQRLESVKARHRESEKQRALVQKALSQTDSVQSNKKIVFDSDSEGEVEASQERSEGGSQSAQAKRPRLFAESSDSDDDQTTDTARFSIKPQFEGEKGLKLLKLQNKFKGDGRFQLDTRFVESDSEPETQTDTPHRASESASALQGQSESENQSEKACSLRVLEEVMGRRVNVRSVQADKRKPVGVHYDPAREDHQQFVISKSTDKKHTRARPVAVSAPVAPPVNVSGDKFYEVRSSLKDLFSGGEGHVAGEEGDTQTNSGFSLLQTFGQETSNQLDAASMETSGADVKLFPWQQEREESSEEETETGFRTHTPHPHSGPAQSFFFAPDDPRLEEGLQFFLRQESMEKIREDWQQRRAGLVEAYRMRRKRTLRKKHSQQVFQAKLQKRRKFNNHRK